MFEAVDYKQLVFEPFFGGGLVTVLAIPVIYLTGVRPLFFVMLAVFVIAVLTGLFYVHPREMKDRELHTREMEQQERAATDPEPARSVPGLTPAPPGSDNEVVGHESQREAPAS